MHTSEAAQKLAAMGDLDIRRNKFPLQPLASKVKVVTVLYLPAEVPDYEVLEVLGQYGKTYKINREKFRDFPTLETGARKVVMAMEKDVPSYISVHGFRAVCNYVGIKKTCRRCGQPGHSVVTCTAMKCARCGDFGHEEGTCTTPCKRCGGEHSSKECPVDTYAGAVSGSQVMRTTTQAADKDDGNRDVDSQAQVAVTDGIDGADNIEEDREKRQDDGPVSSVEESASELVASLNKDAELSRASVSSQDTKEWGSDMDANMQVIEGTLAVKRPPSSGSGTSVVFEADGSHHLPGQLKQLTALERDASSPLKKKKT